MAKAMSERMCDAIGVSGEEGHVRARLRAYAEQGVDVCVLNPLAPTPELQRATFSQLADVLAGLTFTRPGVERATSR
ncbi:MAG: hypothetical protein QM813_08915 [Verrucomicrobiota bacterium]